MAQAHDGHRERMKESFLAYGLEPMNDVNALELLLFYAIPRRDTNELAHALLDQFGSLEDVFHASLEELTAVPGIGEHAAALLLLVPQIMKKSAVSKTREIVQIRSSADAAAYLMPRFMNEQDEVLLMRPGDAATHRITLTGEEFQTVDGFGLAITQASCYNLLKMAPAERTAFLKEVFDREEGMGSSLVRVCIGGSDFSMDEFSWCDEPGMEHFGVHPLDEQYLFPILDEIYAINPDVQIIASPWSCPLWMKVGEDGRTPHNNWVAGHLGEAYYRDYADYVVRWIKETLDQGDGAPGLPDPGRDPAERAPAPRQFHVHLHVLAGAEQLPQMGRRAGFRRRGPQDQGTALRP